MEILNVLGSFDVNSLYSVVVKDRGYDMVIDECNVSLCNENLVVKNEKKGIKHFIRIQSHWNFKMSKNVIIIYKCNLEYIKISLVE